MVCAPSSDFSRSLLPRASVRYNWPDARFDEWAWEFCEKYPKAKDDDLQISKLFIYQFLYSLQYQCPVMQTVWPDMAKLFTLRLWIWFIQKIFCEVPKMQGLIQKVSKNKESILIKIWLIFWYFVCNLKNQCENQFVVILLFR